MTKRITRRLRWLNLRRKMLVHEIRLFRGEIMVFGFKKARANRKISKAYVKLLRQGVDKA